VAQCSGRSSVDTDTRTRQAGRTLYVGLQRRVLRRPRTPTGPSPLPPDQSDDHDATAGVRGAPSPAAGAGRPPYRTGGRARRARARRRRAAGPLNAAGRAETERAGPGHGRALAARAGTTGRSAPPAGRAQGQERSRSGQRGARAAEHVRRRTDGRSAAKSSEQDDGSEQRIRRSSANA
jgi:hypothetical protein